MGYLFGQIWVWIVIAFVLGLLIGLGLALLLRRKTVEVHDEELPFVGGDDSEPTRRLSGTDWGEGYPGREGQQESSGAHIPEPNRPAPQAESFDLFGAGPESRAAAEPAAVPAESFGPRHDFTERQPHQPVPEPRAGDARHQAPQQEARSMFDPFPYDPTAERGEEGEPLPYDAQTGPIGRYPPEQSGPRE
ncbi:hypothetical protein FOS14_12490 [Skermania sp. ID1734]|uniref:hypothetical protein n=1 Tax=Skermania sp. ID1734 TaxID=2597516 RepID=UPI00117CE941|nr:hypothetical protein [Skermania sp. ID1734]TSD99183.1 hypothetical protein FOS14_12490 [Skermania sp. ID1734]